MLWVIRVSFSPNYSLSISVSQDYRIEKKWSAVGFCSGAIAGLVAITPGSGFVGSRMSFPEKKKVVQLTTHFLHFG